MPTIIRGGDSFDTSNVATQTELDAQGPQLATAWVNFDGTVVDVNNHCTIRDSYNVDYVLRTGTGFYTVYFEVAMDNNNYIWAGSTKVTTDAIASMYEMYTSTPRSISSFEVRTSTSGASFGGTDNNIAIFGGKA